MFAVVRTGGKQYRVAPGDKIVVEKLDGNAGDKVTLGDILLAGDGSDLKSTDGLTVAAEIVAQAKADKVTIFKKRRRHNYRRKKGHRQQHTILKIVAIGDHKEQKTSDKAADKAPAKAAKPAETKPAPEAAPQVDTQPTPNPAPDNEKQANPPHNGEGPAEVAKPKAAKPKAEAKAKPADETPSTKNAAPAKAGAKKTPKAK
ncbi:50S ribosomal protein L21 [Sphingomonas sp.]|uniref:50S ribosomal protein L21 n=1 Tax=Sphingomonas sp. TaxID=28214 RepID=UPI0025DA9E22|nr:50S ribosomal protein L21 [Sphingomonas sp.]MBV9528755.1 50S ribosomal protein L21 [Sphingomonas sp.]